MNMDIIQQALFLVAGVPTIVGIVILVVLAPRPSTAQDHLRGTGRVLVLAGTAFGVAQVLNGYVPPWPFVLVVLGGGFSTVLRARKYHLRALASEQPDDGQESGI